jgi:hypothetical protein
MRALTSLNMSKNGLLSKEGGTVLGEMLKGNTLLKELDVSSSGSGFAKELAVGIKDNGAMTSLNLADNSIGGFYTAKGYSDEKFHPTPGGKKA